jgi:hypothetical protein
MHATKGIGVLAIGVGVAGIALIAPILLWRSSINAAGVGSKTGAVWLLEVGSLVLLVMGAGWLITDRYFGIVIDSRNRASLSRLQAALWTLLVLSALATATLVNAHILWLDSQAEVAVLVKAASSAQSVTALLPFSAVNFSIPDELLAAIGIAGFSLVATPMAQSTKTGQAPDPVALAAVQAREGGAANVEQDGNIFGRPTKAGAVWADIFRGDDIDSANTIDLTKVQQFVITLVLVGAYGAVSG